MPKEWTSEDTVYWHNKVKTKAVSVKETWKDMASTCCMSCVLDNLPNASKPDCTQDPGEVT